MKGRPWIVLWALLIAPMAWGAATRTTTLAHATARVTPHAATLSITLPVNPSTGYVWYLQHLSPGLWVPDHHHTLPSTSHLVGAPGRSVWTFHLPSHLRTIPHTLQVRFAQHRGLHQVGNTACFALLYHPAMRGTLDVRRCTPPPTDQP